MADPTIVVDLSPNFTKGRGGYLPVAIVYHIEAGSESGTDAWFDNPRAQVSAHYSIGKDGTIHKHVDIQDTAWHCGVVDHPTAYLVTTTYPGVNPNKYTIGIEHEGQSGDKLTDVQYASTLWLSFTLTQTYMIPVVKDHLIQHCEINADHAGCPGTGFPMAQLMLDLIRKGMA